MDQSTAVFKSENMHLAQAQQLASIAYALGAPHSPTHLFEELYAMRGTETLDKLCSDLVNVLESLSQEMVAADDDMENIDTIPPDSVQMFNARTTERLTFDPIQGLTSSKRQATLPKHSHVRAYQNALGSVTLFAWIDNDPTGEPDYSRVSASITSFRLED